MAFKKGISGNMAGRPKNTLTANLRKKLSEATPAIIDKLIEMALDGDATAIKAVLDRVIPVLKPQAMSINLPSAGTLIEQGNTIIQAIMSGQVAPDTGAQLLTALNSQSRTVDFTETTLKVDELMEKTKCR